ncbi:MAG: D-glycero-beta-D-manno-heptose-7-phosphate kinase [Elusimicrobiota bacterium]|jgi:D-beta-D-heptose 7-phosphate kinase/D-beta-D-heptose 1-phosphate adenosyltransferase|nr:D-glycero-beta-D-manno-heptose-7-phosphate kinase [Elusimicrobiota bacterium]
MIKNISKNKLFDLLSSFKRQKIAVIGDTMVDLFIWGSVKRISPEAPVPIVEVSKESQTLGGAGNVAANIAALGGTAYLVSAMGNDSSSDLLVRLLEEKNISSKYLVEDSDKPTITKTRIIAASQQVVRVDKEIKGEPSPDAQEKILINIEEIIPKSDGVIISDYGKGVVGDNVLRKAIELSRKHKIPISVDPKLDNFKKYYGVTTITPNTKEAIEGMKASNIEMDTDIAELGKKILEFINSDSVLITRSEKGMMLIEAGGKVTNIPTRAREVYDVTGAGDTVISTMTLALAAGADFLSAAEISNFAAGIVVAKIGTATASPKEIQSAIEEFYSK